MNGRNLLKYFTVTTAIFTLALGLASSTAALAMSEADFRSSIVGKTWKWKSGKTGGTVKFYKSGKVKVVIKGKGGFRDKGTWRYRRSGHCTKYKKIRKGEEKCFSMKRKGKTYVDSAGTVLY